MHAFDRLRIVLMTKYWSSGDILRPRFGTRLRRASLGPSGLPAFAAVQVAGVPGLVDGRLTSAFGYRLLHGLNSRAVITRTLVR